MGSNGAYHVNIRIDFQNGHMNFTYEPSALHTTGQDTVVWRSNDGPFAIEFQEDTPGDKMEMTGARRDDHWESDPLTIREDARGHYHYGVAVSLARPVDRELIGRVVLDSGCPEIIVN